MKQNSKYFTQSCFIRKNTPELREKLRRLGQRANTLDDFKCEWLAANYGMFTSVSKGFENLDSDDIDCGTNEELFLAIAALRDDTDKNQWFVHKSKAHWWKTELNSFKEYFNDSNEDIDFDYEDFHKATVEELIEHFK